MEYEKMSASALRNECRKRGLPVSAMGKASTGKVHCNWLGKDALVAALRAADGNGVQVPPGNISIATVPPQVSDGASGASAEPVAVKAEEIAPALPPPPPVPDKRKSESKELVRKWRMFLSDFQFPVNVRFLNTAFRQDSAEAVAAYVCNYFALLNSPFTNDVKEKCKCAEAKALFKETAKFRPEARINSRLVIWYGEPGTGKTTKAVRENPGADCVLCNSSISADELFQKFKFTDGKPDFRPCYLRTAMEEGKTIILDEINKLPEDSLFALQTVTDGKDEVTIGDEHVKIKSGFRIVGTMNLNIGDQVYGLPPALVDRAEEIREFVLSDEELLEIAG